jgi:hypothetical protein
MKTKTEREALIMERKQKKIDRKLGKHPSTLSKLKFWGKKEKKNPELDVEINIIKKDTGFIESHKLYAENRKVTIDNIIYNLKPDGMILEPTKDSFLPVYFFNEGVKEPYNFKNLNKRIPSRVINLLYNTDTYRTWLEMERKNINLILVIIGIATLIILAVYGWLNFAHGQLPKIPFINN